jgi:hypothetical protein
MSLALSGKFAGILEYEFSYVMVSTTPDFVKGNKEILNSVSQTAKICYKNIYAPVIVNYGPKEP